MVNTHYHEISKMIGFFFINFNSIKYFGNIFKNFCLKAIFAVISPSMALVTSAGFLWELGYPFSNILTVVPFLVITIGVDDAFLILAGWRHSRFLKISNTLLN